MKDSKWDEWDVLNAKVLWARRGSQMDREPSLLVVKVDVSYVFLLKK